VSEKGVAQRKREGVCERERDFGNVITYQGISEGLSERTQ
jgi:hypothetical protein